MLKMPHEGNSTNIHLRLTQWDVLTAFYLVCCVVLCRVVLCCVVLCAGYMQRSKDALQEVCLLYTPCILETQLISLGGKHLYPLSHLTSSSIPPQPRYPRLASNLRHSCLSYPSVVVLVWTQLELRPLFLCK